MLAKAFPIIVPVDDVMLPVAVIYEPTLKVVPALTAPRDEMFPYDEMFQPAFIDDCVMLAPLHPSIVHFAKELAISPTFNPPLHLISPSK